jgi:hypothetical protein
MRIRRRRLTHGQIELLFSIIDNWVEGITAAKEATTTDPTIETADRLLDLMSGYDDDLEQIKQIRIYLAEDACGRG